MAAVFRLAVLTNEADRDLLSEHPELTVLEPPAVDGIVLVAEATGLIVGFVTARALGDDVITVTDLFVDPDHMRSGVGRALLDAVVAAATESGRTGIEVQANWHAVAFYERVGFVAVQEVQVEFGSALRMAMSVSPKVAAPAQRVDEDRIRSTVEEKVDVDAAPRRTRIGSV